MTPTELTFGDLFCLCALCDGTVAVCSEGTCSVAALNFKPHPAAKAGRAASPSRHAIIIVIVVVVIVMDTLSWTEPEPPPPPDPRQVNLILQFSTNTLINLKFRGKKAWLNHHKWVMLQKGEVISALVSFSGGIQSVAHCCIRALSFVGFYFFFFLITFQQGPWQR